MSEALSTKLRLTEVQEFLCLCLVHRDHLHKGKIANLYQKLGDDHVYKEAKLNGVASIVADALSLSVSKGSLPLHWDNEYVAVETRVSGYMDEMERAGNALAQVDIPMVALKNSGITKALYPYYGACPMGDVDVLVREDDFKDAHRALTEAGYRLKFRSKYEEDNIESALQGGGAEYQVDLPSGQTLWFELQWRPVAGRWIQPHQEPKSRSLMERSISIENSSVRILSSVDNLLQVCLHTAKHSYVRSPGFRLHTDVDRIVRAQPIDWMAFLTVVHELRVKTAVYFSLSLASALLGTPIPSNILSDLRPNKLKERMILGSLLHVGLFEPEQPKWNKISYVFFVLLLFDSASDLIRGMFPEAVVMKKRFGFESNWLLPIYHVRRVTDLLLRRDIR